MRLDAVTRGESKAPSPISAPPNALQIRYGRRQSHPATRAIIEVDHEGQAASLSRIASVVAVPVPFEDPDRLLTDTSESAH